LDTSTGLEDDPAVHVLTKIFIVLVSLLSVMLVPLVVTYVHNEDAYKAKFQEADAQRIAARSTLEIAQASFAAASTRKDNEIAERTSTIRDLERQLVQKSQELQSATARLAEAENLDAQIMGQISILSNAMDAGQKLTESLIQEVRQLRREQLAAERQKVELDEALRDSQSKLEVSQRDLRAMQD
jgi:chromosome segregation ATPase